jgi:hypothetical protein
MSKTGGKDITPPPLLGDDEHASIAETSTSPTVEELIKQIEKLNVELTKLKTKKDKKNISVSEDDDSSYEEDASNKAKKDKKSMISHPIMLCLLTTITCLAPRLILSYPLGRLLILMELTIINGSIA